MPSVCAQVNRQRCRDVLVSSLEPASARWRQPNRLLRTSNVGLLTSQAMKPAAPDPMPRDVMIVEDDPIIALDFEETLRGFGVETVRSAGSVAKALRLIAESVPDFALLDVALVREKSFAIAERLDALAIPFAFVTGYGADVRLPPPFAQRPRLPKPCSSDALRALLTGRSGAR